MMYPRCAKLACLLVYISCLNCAERWVSATLRFVCMHICVNREHGLWTCCFDSYDQHQGPRIDPIHWLEHRTLSKMKQLSWLINLSVGHHPFLYWNRLCLYGSPCSASQYLTVPHSTSQYLTQPWFCWIGSIVIIAVDCNFSLSVLLIFYCTSAWWRCELINQSFHKSRPSVDCTAIVVLWIIRRV